MALASRERASAGELGYLRSRTDGLPIQYLDLINANGELLKVSEDNHPKLVWALGFWGQQLWHRRLAPYSS
jgi:hypothetical protein